MLAAADLRLNDDEREVGAQFGKLLDSVPHDSGRQDVWKRVSGWCSVSDATMGARCRALEVAGGRLLDGAFLATVGLLAPILRLVDLSLYESLLAGDLRGSATLLGRTAGDADGTVVLGALDADVVAVVTDVEVRLIEPVGGVPVVSADPTRQFGRIDIDDRARIRSSHEISPEDLRIWLAAARVSLAADMVGSARAVLEATTAYLKERRQFGQPVAAFQAVQHKLVDMALLVETASVALHYAACCVDAGSDEAPPAAGVAKARAAAAATQCAISCTRLQGAIGLTWENDIHLHLRRAYASDQLLGSAAWLRRELASKLIAGHL